MKTPRGKPTRFAALAVTFLCSVFCAPAQVPSAQNVGPQAATNRSNDQNGKVRVITIDVPGRSISAYAGHTVRNVRGQELGTIKDVVVDVHSGRIVYAAIAGQSGDTLRLIPFAALNYEPGTNGLTVEIEQTQWAQVAPINARDFEEGRITLSAGERRQLAETFGQSEPTRPAPDSPPLPRGVENGALTTHPGGGSVVMPLGDLRDKRVSTGTDNVGTISDVVVDADRMTAAAIISPEKDFKIAEQKFLVPLRQLNLASRDQDPITTTLTRIDFEQAQRSNEGAAKSDAIAPPKIDREPELTPTGRTDSARHSSDFSVSDTLAVVQRVLASEPAPSSSNVEIEQRDGKLQLRGSVKTEALKNRVEKAVRESAPSAQIDNQIRVEPR